MTLTDLKQTAIKQFVDTVESTEDETTLEMILEFLKGIKGDDDNTLNLSQHYSAIKTKYSSVLSKLAR